MKSKNKRKKKQNKTKHVMSASELAKNYAPPQILVRNESKRRQRELFASLTNPLDPLFDTASPLGLLPDNLNLYKFNSILDWHLRIGEEEMAAKRRRMDVENAIGKMTLRILANRMARRQQKSTVDAGSMLSYQYNPCHSQ